MLFKSVILIRKILVNIQIKTCMTQKENSIFLINKPDLIYLQKNTYQISYYYQILKVTNPLNPHTNLYCSFSFSFTSPYFLYQ